MNKIQNEKWVNALPEETVSVAEEINIEIAKVIAERIKTIGELSPSDVKKLTNSLEYLGADFQKITKLIAKYSGKGQQAVVDTLKQVADANDEFAKTFYSAKGIAAHTQYNDPYLHNLVEAMTRQTAAEFTNLSQTLAYKIDDRYIPLRKMYSRAIDKAIYEVQSGTVDYHTAMRKTVRELATGLRVKDSALVVDKETGEVKLHWESGYSRRLDSHVRQNLIDGVKQLQAQMLDYHGERFGSDGVELSAHAISAPDHLPVQGRQFSNEEFDKLQNAMEFEDVKGNEYEPIKRPIGQWNCRHVRFPIVIGISEPVHSEEQLKEFAKNSKRKYDLTQQQRAMETKLRSLKTQRIAASAAGDELEAKRLQRKINEQQIIYRRFSEKHNLLYDTKRASVEGYRRMSTKITEKSFETSTGTPNIDEKIINSKNYKEKFSKISNDIFLNDSIYKHCKNTLINKNGGYFEDLTILNEDGSYFDSTKGIIENETTYSEELDKKILAQPPHTLIAIHNHGTNMPPTGSDFISAGFRRYKFGIVCTHDGKIFKYSSQNARVFSRFLFDKTVDKFCDAPYNLSRYNAIIKTLKNFEKDYNIEWSEL